MSRIIHRRNATLADGMAAGMKKAVEVNKGGSAMAAHSEALAFRKSIFPTGLFEVDVNLRPTFGSRIQILADAHKGKTLLTYMMMGSAHRTCRQCLTPIIDFVHDWTGEVATTCKCGQNDPMRALLIETENSWDPAWAATWGVNIKPNFDETDKNQAEEIYENVFMTKDATFVMIRGSDGDQTRVITESLVRSGAVDLVVVDSLAGIVPAGRREGKMQIGDHARLTTQFISGVVGAQGEAANLDGVAPTLIMVNQYRLDLKARVMPGMPSRKMAVGGEALKYGNSITWDLKTKFDDYDAGAEGRNYGDCTLTAKKDKESGATHASADYRVYLRDVKKSSVQYHAGDTDEGGKIYSFLKELGAVDKRWFQKKGAKYVIFGREFTKVADISKFLSRRDVGHMLRLPIYAQKFPPTLRQHLGAENYNYTPFKDDEPILEMYEEAQKSLGGNVQTRQAELAPVMLRAKTKKAARGGTTSKEAVAELAEEQPDQPDAGGDTGEIDVSVD